jgi:hypothetical protein
MNRYAASAIFFLLACDPTVSLKGSVMRPDGTPVAGAKVSIACSSLSGGSISAMTDVRGAFSTTNIGCVEKDCSIDVAVSGEPVQHFPPKNYCTNLDGTCCRAIQANLTIP